MNTIKLAREDASFGEWNPVQLTKAINIDRRGEECCVMDYC